MPVFKCSYCGYYTSELHSINEHYKTWHQDKKVFPCKTCGTVFTRKYDLERHPKEAHTKTEEDQIKCSHCEFKTLRKSKLKRQAQLSY